MGLKYFHEFKGQDNVLNRVEIHDNSSITASEIKGSDAPFVLEYPEVRKLDPIQSSGATISLISETNFQFIDLHTDNMQKYLVKFYRNGALYWLGWLDSEMYSEVFTDTPPYNVEFSASDFNILERIKFLTISGEKYSDIQPLMTQIKRCFDLLKIPFDKIYIGCTTLANGVTLSSEESVLHQLYIQSRNFYDEDGEAMTCKEVLSSILEPFGLVMLQRDASIYIFDYNILKSGNTFKTYNFSDLQYISDSSINSLLGDINTIGINGVESSLEYEEMINNVKITSSIYATPSSDKHEVTEENVSNLISETNKRVYANAKGWQDASRYIIYKNTNGGDIIAGADFGKSQTFNYTLPVYKGYILGGGKYKLKIKGKIYISTKSNPFNERPEPSDDDKNHSVVLRTYARLYITDNLGVPKKYASFNRGIVWNNVIGEIPYDYPLFFLSAGLNSQSTILNAWASIKGYGWISAPDEQQYINGKGENDGCVINIGGNDGMLVLELKNTYDIYNPGAIEGSSRDFDYSRKGWYNQAGITEVLLNDISMTLHDEFNKEVSSVPDVEFDSYINKAVRTDLDEKKLYVVSANEESFPLGQGLLLRKDGNSFHSQTSFTRSEQTDILERLLMCTIHSNYAPKNKKLKVNIKMVDCPAQRVVTALPLLQGDFLITGCTLDFAQANMNVLGVNYSEDTAKLSDIPYV